MKKLKDISLDTTNVEIYKVSDGKYFVKTAHYKAPFIAKNKKELEEKLKFFSTTQSAVIRVSPSVDEEDPKYYDLDDQANDYSLKVDNFEKELKNLEKIGVMSNTMYVGNAYYIETFGKDRQYTTRLLEILKMDNNNLPKGLKIDVEWDYVPDWAYDDEDEGDE